MKNSLKPDKYKVEYPDLSWSCVIEIDLMHINKLGTTVDAIKEMVKFWTGWSDRLKLNDNDWVKTFIQQLGREVLFILFEHPHLNIDGVIKAFEDREGYCPMNGKYGIKIIDLDAVLLDHLEFNVTYLNPSNHE